MTTQYVGMIVDHDGGGGRWAVNVSRPAEDKRGEISEGLSVADVGGTRSGASNMTRPSATRAPNLDTTLHAALFFFFEDPPCFAGRSRARLRMLDAVHSYRRRALGTYRSLLLTSVRPSRIIHTPFLPREPP